MAHVETHAVFQDRVGVAERRIDVEVIACRHRKTKGQRVRDVDDEDNEVSTYYIFRY